MSADWYPDPLGRADLRRHDGSRWTHDVITDDQQYTEPIGLPLPRSAPDTAPVVPPPIAPAPPQPRRTAPRAPAVRPPAQGVDGLLIASGVLALVTGLITVIVTLRVMALFSDLDRFTCEVGLPACGRISGVYAIGISVIVVGALFIAAGLGGCLRAPWAQRTLVILGGLCFLLFLAGLFAGGGLNAMIPVVWFGAIGGLALASGVTAY